MTDYRAQFEQAIGSSELPWRSLDIRVIAIRDEDVLHNLWAVAYLSHAHVDDVPVLATSVENDVLLARQFVLTPDALPSLLDGVTAGEWIVGGHTIQFKHVDHTGIGRPAVYSYTFFDSWRNAFRSQVHRWPSHALTATMGSSWDAIRLLAGASDVLHAEAQSLPVSYPDFDALVRNILGPSGRGGIGANVDRILDVVAQYEFRFDSESVVVDNGKASVDLVAASRYAAEYARVQIGLRGGPFVDVTPPSVDHWTVCHGGVGCRVSAEIGAAPDVDFVLRHKSRPKEAVHWFTATQWVASSTAPLHARAYLEYDHDMNRLRAALVGKDARQHAVAVGRLFHLLGFHVNPIALDKGLTEAPDLLAFGADGGCCLAVECTTGAIDSGGKIGKLASRVSALRGQLGGVEVFGVMVTALAEAANGDLRKAYDENICVLTSGDCLDALKRRLGGETANAQFAQDLRVKAGA